MEHRVPFVVTGCLTLFVTAICFLAFTEAGKAQNSEHGKELFEKRCSGCHALDKEKEGPRLRGVYGRTSGTVASFQYSKGLKNAHPAELPRHGICARAVLLTRSSHTLFSGTA